MNFRLKLKNNASFKNDKYYLKGTVSDFFVEIKFSSVDTYFVYRTKIFCLYSCVFLFIKLFDFVDKKYDDIRSIFFYDKYFVPFKKPKCYIRQNLKI